MKLSNELTKQIEKYVSKNQPEFDWNPSDFYRETGHIIKEILKNGLDSYLENLWEQNLDYVCELEGYAVNGVFENFQEELLSEFVKHQPDENPESIEDEIKEYIRENFEIYVAMNQKQLLSNLPDITCLIKIYSNYDCTNSFDTFEGSEYLQEVFKPFKKAISKEDFMFEHQNGAYGGSLFCFAFKTDIKDYMELKNGLKESITIPGGCQFGFHSDFQGSSSPFEKVTDKAITVKRQYGKTEYDAVSIIADLEQSGYSMESVFGSTDFIREQNITVK